MKSTCYTRVTQEESHEVDRNMDNHNMNDPSEKDGRAWRPNHKGGEHREGTKSTTRHKEEHNL